MANQDCIQLTRLQEAFGEEIPAGLVGLQATDGSVTVSDFGAFLSQMWNEGMAAMEAA